MKYNFDEEKNDRLGYSWGWVWLIFKDVLKILQHTSVRKVRKEDRGDKLAERVRLTKWGTNKEKNKKDKDKQTRTKDTQTLKINRSAYKLGQIDNRRYEHLYTVIWTDRYGHRQSRILKLKATLTGHKHKDIYSQRQISAYRDLDKTKVHIQMTSQT